MRVLVILILIWWGGAQMLQMPLLPSPFIVLMEGVIPLLPHLLLHMMYSFLRIVGGVTVAIGIGIPLGVISGYSPKADRIIGNVIYWIYPIPKIALLPLVMVFLGLGENTKVVMIVLIILFQLMIVARDATRQIPKESFYSLYVLGACKKEILLHVIIPAILPKIFTSLRISMATSIAVLFLTETFGTDYGMGYFIMDAWMRINYVELYAGIVMISIMGFGLFFFIDVLEKRFCKWARYEQNI